MNAAIKLEEYPDLLEQETLAYSKRMQYARDMGTDTLVFTGNTEPQINMHFILRVMQINETIRTPFVKVEIKTTGVMLNKEKLAILKDIGIDTISLSLSGLTYETNFNYNGTPESIRFNIIEFAKNVKDINLNLRLCLNLTDFYDAWDYYDIIHFCQYVMLADQITFQELYESAENTIQDMWIASHKVSETKLEEIKNALNTEENQNIHINNHCQGEKPILQPNCKLYSLWDKKSSLIY
jgi:sulfatase maturation enzyme AslB (radical SAM superfamily)